MLLCGNRLPMSELESALCGDEFFWRMDGHVRRGWSGRFVKSAPFFC